MVAHQLRPLSNALTKELYSPGQRMIPGGMQGTRRIGLVVSNALVTALDFATVDDTCTVCYERFQVPLLCRRSLQSSDRTRTRRDVAAGRSPFGCPASHCDHLSSASALRELRDILVGMRAGLLGMCHRGLRKGHGRGMHRRLGDTRLRRHWHWRMGERMAMPPRGYVHPMLGSPTAGG